MSDQGSPQVSIIVNNNSDNKIEIVFDKGNSQSRRADAPARKKTPVQTKGQKINRLIIHPNDDDNKPVYLEIDKDVFSFSDVVIKPDSDIKAGHPDDDGDG